MLSILKRWFCRHEFYFNDISRLSDDNVSGACHKCGGNFTAFCGIDLPGKLIGYRPTARTGA